MELRSRRIQGKGLGSRVEGVGTEAADVGSILHDTHTQRSLILSSRLKKEQGGLEAAAGDSLAAPGHGTMLRSAAMQL